MLFKKKQYISGTSLSMHAWHNLVNNKLAITAFSFILLICLIAILGYSITPDSTPYANRQTLEIASIKPGTKIQFLYHKKNIEPNSQSLISHLSNGTQSDFTRIPFNKYEIKGEQIIIDTYTKTPVEDVLRLSFNLADIYYAIDTETTLLNTDKKELSFTLINGQSKSISVKELQELVVKQNIKTQRFLLGTDRYGRDYLSRLIIGARVSISVGFISVFISLIIGITLGSIAGFFGGKTDHLIVWLINVIWSIPTLLLVIAITFALGRGFWQVFIAVGLTMWVEVARVVRGQVLGMKEKEFVEAGRALGFKNSRIIFKHILPNIMGPVIVISAANFAAAILIEAGLSFLGIGIQPPMPSWGSMIKENYAYIILDSAYLAILPGIAIMLMVLAFMILGNGLREALNVKEQQI